MTKDQLIAKLADLEWEDFEVKAAKGGLPKDTWETVSAFSNTSGGWLLFGIKQNGKQFEIQGLNNPEKVEQDFLNTIRSGKFNVFVPTQQAKHNIGSKTVLAFYVPVSRDKPVYYNSLQNTFIRRGSSDQRATKEEIDAMFRDQTFGTKTSELAPKTSKADLHTTSLKQYRDYMARFNPDVSYNRYDEDEFLTKLRIVDNEQLTYAGLLFLGKRESIEKHFPDFRIDLLEIPGTTITDATTNYTFRLDEYENLWDYYFACFQRLKQKVDVAFQITNQGFGQELSPGLKAIREALVNMLMHADYFAPAHSRIRIFTNHIEFYNPGGLPKPLEELKAKDLSLPRNPLISKLFRMVRLAENAGYGFDKIETNWEQYNHTAPEYDISFDATILKLYTQKEGAGAKTSEKLRGNFGETSEKLQEELKNKPANIDLIIRLLTDNYENFKIYITENFGVSSGTLRKHFGNTSETLRKHFGDKEMVLLLLIIFNKDITAKEAAKVIGVSDRTIETYFTKLKSKDMIERVGSATFGGYWTLKKD
ncbi:RNA-binding domain-containing protein [Sinomicrobium weinanense]|uniref:DNA binding domain-containing protein n=1 Tax=Sinomicrobium weinanense TaxID=2842200 RepID=A0A926JVP8_9FLAO|nr:RNA-binding domain-containing protein [Sinomicrobium weinanense]MBC9798241.1 putative DNA binding domain-containing protein [Sinomicrobium weinanense]MBU3123255.1 putative DNA binding domain-containing protein [Sinomicrobium weinanense]